MLTAGGQAIKMRVEGSPGIRLGVLASGRGSNFKSLVDHIKLGVLENVKIGVLISNNPSAGALKIAEDNGIESVVIESALRGGETEEERSALRRAFEEEALRILKDRRVDLVVLAGFMQVLTPYFIRRYQHRIMNIHPSLLPSFPGLRAQRQALEHGVKVTGCTIHYVDESVDQGPIILQHPVPVMEGDTEETLSDRILVFEHRLLPKAVQLHADGRLRVTGRRVEVNYSGGWEERWRERQRAYIELQEREWRARGKPLEAVLG